MAGGKGTKEIATRYPVTSGLTAGTTKTEGRKIDLIPTMGTFVLKRRTKGIR